MMTSVTATPLSGTQAEEACIRSEVAHGSGLMTLTRVTPLPGRESLTPTGPQVYYLSLSLLQFSLFVE